MHEQDVNDVIQMSQIDNGATKKDKKKKKYSCDYEENIQNPKYMQAVTFIIYLLHSSLERLHQGKDFVCRAFLKLIEQMHQE